LLHNISMMKNKLEKLCFHPFEDHPDSAMLMVGLLAFVLMILVSYLGNIVFDCLIQTHLAASEGWNNMLGIISNAGILTLGMYGIAKILYPAVRLLDILNNVLIARIPLLFLGLLTIPMQTLLPASDLTKDEVFAYFDNLNTLQMLGLSAMAVAVLALLIYFFYLLVVGVKHSINSKKAAHGFVIVLYTFCLELLATLVYRSWFLGSP